VELETVADDFFDKFASGIKQYDGVKGLRGVVRILFWFGDDHCVGELEMRQPIF